YRVFSSIFFILFVVNKINPNFCVSRLYYSGIDAKLTR
ncbi:hypothetical protein D046_6733B, partial [Vibrio parahaemolyticus V-223/04]